MRILLAVTLYFLVAIMLEYLGGFLAEAADRRGEKIGPVERSCLSFGALLWPIGLPVLLLLWAFVSGEQRARAAKKGADHVRIPEEEGGGSGAGGSSPEGAAPHHGPDRG